MKHPQHSDDDEMPPEPQRVAAGLFEIAKTLPRGSASIVRRAAELLAATPDGDITEAQMLDQEQPD